MEKVFTVESPVLRDETFLQELSDAGFTGVDLLIYPDAPYICEGDLKENAENIRTLLEKYHLTCKQVHLPWYEIFTSSEIVDEAVETSITNALHLMAHLGVKWGAYHPMSATNFAYDRKRAMHDNLEKLKRHRETAEQLGVGIAVENLPIFPDCPQYHFFTSDYEDHMELIDRLDSEYIGVCWDFGHANFMPYRQEDVLDQMGSRIKILHTHNNFEQYDLHLSPSLGTISWESILPVLTKHGFMGDLTLEVTVPKYCRREYLALCGAMAEKMLSMF